MSFSLKEKGKLLTKSVASGLKDLRTMGCSGLDSRGVVSTVLVLLRELLSLISLS